MALDAPGADLRGRVVLIAGADLGAGPRTALGLASLGARVWLGCHDAARGALLRRDIMARGGSPELGVVALDGADPDSVAACARALDARGARLDVLVHNVGLWSRRRRVTADGHELTWATNVLGYARLTETLLPALRRARGRVLAVVARRAQGLDLTDVEFVRRPYTGDAAHAQSQQAARLLTWAFARRLAGEGVTAHALLAGDDDARSLLFRKAFGVTGLVGLFAPRRPPRASDDCAETLVWLSARDDADRSSGRLWRARRELACELRDAALEQRLFELCRDMLRPTLPPTRS